jgi:molecular chaperone DnaK
LPHDEILISRTTASVDAIPASHSIGLEVRERVGGAVTLDFLVKEGDQLPLKGKKIFKAAESLRAGAPNSIRFKLWEGEIREPITDNNFVGVFSIRGSDFADGIIAAGAELICEYEVSDSGAIFMNVSVPSIGGAFESGRNFYSRQEALVDYSAAREIILSDVEETGNRLSDISGVVSDPKLVEVEAKLAEVRGSLDDGKQHTPEEAKQASDRILEAKRLMAEARKNNLAAVRSIELENLKSYFDEHLLDDARQSEITSIENLHKSSTRVISKPSGEFEALLEEMRTLIFGILWRQDWFVLDRYKKYKQNPHNFADPAKYSQLIARGDSALAANDLETVKEVVYMLSALKLGSSDEREMFSSSNIVRG